MALSRHILALIPILILVGLVCISGVAIYKIKTLSLPISTVTATATTILPAILGVALQGGGLLGRRSWISTTTASKQPSLLFAIIFTILIIYDTVISTLAMNHIVPSNVSRCRLEGQWSWLFSNKRAEEIRRIQDRHQCCGLNSVRDRAWPFPDSRHTAAACQETFGRLQSCFAGWRSDEQTTAALIFIVAVSAFVLKLVLLFLHRRDQRPQLAIQGALSHEQNDDATQAPNSRRFIGNTYRDEQPSPTNRNISDGHSADEEDQSTSNIGPGVVQPRSQHDEWRDP